MTRSNPDPSDIVIPAPNCAFWRSETGIHLNAEAIPPRVNGIDWKLGPGIRRDDGHKWRPLRKNVVTGSAVVKQVFGIRGMGRYFVQGALNRDYTPVLGVVLAVAALIVGINTGVDALRGWMDPRLENDA